MLFGPGVAAIGTGLLYTLNKHSSTGRWIGYQIIAGLGLGSCFQVPIMAGQALAAPEDVSVVTSILLCTFQLPCVHPVSRYLQLS